jgi:hypothetical protein
MPIPLQLNHTYEDSGGLLWRLVSEVTSPGIALHYAAVQVGYDGETALVGGTARVFRSDGKPSDFAYDSLVREYVPTITPQTIWIVAADDIRLRVYHSLEDAKAAQVYHPHATIHRFVEEAG